MENLVYLSGPVKGLSYKDAAAWREYVRNKLPKHIKTLSPLRGRDHLKLKDEDVIDGTYEEYPLTSAKGINTRDYNDVKRCDLVFANLHGTKEISIGTVMEIAWARAHDKPVVLVMDAENVHKHPLLEYACGYIVKDLDEGLDIVVSVLGPDDVEWFYDKDN